MFARLDDKIALVTGAGRGIGAGIAVAFAAAGATVVVATRTAASGQETVDAITASGGNAFLISVDVGNADASRSMVEQTVAERGGLDILIHNAGICPDSPIETLSDSDLDATLDVNLKAAFWLTRAALPALRRSGAGRLLFTSSVTGPRVSSPTLAHYAASKAGLNGFIKTAALEYARDNITVNGVEPGYIRTPAMEAYGEETIAKMAENIPMNRFGTSADVANAMLFLASSEASYITGQTIIVDGGSILPESSVMQAEFGTTDGKMT